MSNLDNMQKITEVDLGWQKADYVSTNVSVENDDKDADPSKLSFAWFRIQSNMVPSKKEEEERIQALKVQFQNKIINKYGMPYGSPMPKEIKELIKENEKNNLKRSKFDRQRQRLINRQIQKDMDKQRTAEKHQVVFNPFNK